MNLDTTDHVLWPFDDNEEEERDEFDEADMMLAERKLNKSNYNETFKQ